MTKTRTSLAAGMAIVVCLLAGCGGTHQSNVSGTVYLDDEPLRMGNVTYYPTSEGAAVYGRIAEDGTYQLSTGSEAGLKPGEYKVTVIATENPPAASPGQAPPVGRRITPEKYSRVEETDLIVTVSPGSNQIDLPLKSN